MVTSPARRHAIVLALAALTVAAGIALPGVLAKASSPTIVLTVNSTAWGGPDAKAGDGVCETAPGNGVCTLRAAIEEANALNGQPGEILIEVDPSIPLNTPMTGTPNNRPDFMLNNPSPSINRQDVYGAQFNVTSPVTIDLGHRLQPNGTANDNSENTVFYLNGPGIQVLNADQVLSSGSSFVVGPNADDVTIDGDTLGVNNGYGKVFATANYYPERFVVVMQGAKNLTVRNYQVGGYYNSNSDGGIFVFANPVKGAPARITQNILIDDVQVLYNKSGSCGMSAGAGCNTRLVTFWQGDTDGGWGAGYSNNVIDGLTFTNMLVQNMPGGLGGPYAFQFAYPDMTPSASTSDITNLTIENNRFVNNAPWGTMAYNAFITLPYLNYLHGKTSIANNVFTTGRTGNQAGAGTAVFAMGTEPANSTKPSGISITNNYFDGYGNYGAVRTRAVGLVEVTGNTFGPATVAYATAAEESNDTNVMYSMAPGINPYYSSNQAILTWAPKSGAAALTGQTPPGVLDVEPPGKADAPSPEDAALPMCTVTVDVAKPTATAGNTTIPKDPVTLEAYWTTTQTAELYLGKVGGVTGPTATLALALPVGTVTLPDGRTVTPVNPATGAASGFVRLQTHVEGLGQLESSQYSRAVPVTGNCRPSLTLSQAAGQADPTVGRDLHFTLTSSAPLNPDTVGFDAFTVTATPIAQTIDASRLNPRLVSVTPVAGTGDTAFDVVVHVDDSATVAVAVGAEKVATPAGLTNPAAAKTTDGSITFLNPLRVNPSSFTLVTGEPKGKDFTIALAAGAPLPTAEVVFAATVTQAAGTPPVTLSTLVPVIAAGGTSSPAVTVTAAAGAVTANTPAPVTMTVASADPNYNGLVAPVVTPFLFSTDPTIRIVKTAFTDAADASSPERIEATGKAVPSGSRLMDKQAVCFVYTVTNASADDWATNLTNVVVTDSDTRLGSGGVIATIPSLPIGQSAKVAACTTVIPVDTTTGDG